MCGRFALHGTPHAVALQFGLAHEPTYRPSYNIAPGAAILAVRAEASHARTALMLRWGLIPSWARDPSIGHHLVNARAEHMAERPAFRGALHARRCIVPADGFYEWRTEEGRRVPYYVRPRQGGLFGFAALYEWWEGPDGRIGSCAIVTTAANRTLCKIHDRMPAILSARDYAHWLDPDHPDPVALAAALRPAPDDLVRACRVGILVNKVRNDGPELLTPATGGEPADG